MKKCPHCGGTKFKAVLKRPGLIDLSGEEMVIEQEGKKTAYEVCVCANKDCGQTVTNDTLVGNCTCKTCGKEVDEKYTVDGVCIECKMKDEMPDFDTMDPMARMMYVYNLKKNTESKGVAAKADAKEAQGQAVTEAKEAKQEAKTETKTEAKAETAPPAEENKQAAAPSRRRTGGHKPADTPPPPAPVDEPKQEPIAETKQAPAPAADTTPVNNAEEEMVDPPNVDNIEVPF